MPLNTRQHQPQRTAGRRFRWVIAGIFFVAAVALAAQWMWSGLWSSPRPEKPLAVRPAPVQAMPDYDLPDPPAPEIQYVAVPAARPQTIQAEQPPPPPMQRSEPQRGRAVREAERLPSRAWQIQAQMPEATWARDGRREAFATGCALRPGVSILPAVLLTAVNSELPGQVVAETISHVYSPDVGYETKVLVPAGTRIVGRLDKGREMTFDRRRVEIIWTEMTSPAGFGGDLRVTQVALGEAFNASADGSSGTGGRVEHRWGELAGYAVLTTLFNVAQRRATRGEDPIVIESGRTVGTVGHQVLERSLDWEPTISINAGTQVRVMVNDTVRVCRRRPTRRVRDRRRALKRERCHARAGSL